MYFFVLSILKLYNFYNANAFQNNLYINVYVYVICHGITTIFNANRRKVNIISKRKRKNKANFIRKQTEILTVIIFMSKG